MGAEEATFLGLPSELRRIIYRYALGIQTSSNKHAYLPYPSNNDLSNMADVFPNEYLPTNGIAHAVTDNVSKLQKADDQAKKICEHCGEACHLPRRQSLCWSCSVSLQAEKDGVAGPNPLYACHQTYNESIDIFFAQITPEISRPSQLLQYASTVRTHSHSDLVRSICLKPSPMHWCALDIRRHHSGADRGQTDPETNLFNPPVGRMLDELSHYLKPGGLKRALPGLRRITIDFSYETPLESPITVVYCDLAFPAAASSMVRGLIPFVQDYPGLEIQVLGLASKEISQVLEDMLRGKPVDEGFDFHAARARTLDAYVAGGGEREKWTNIAE